jgi:hypothetical protein
MAGLDDPSAARAMIDHHLPSEAAGRFDVSNLTTGICGYGVAGLGVAVLPATARESGLCLSGVLLIDYGAVARGGSRSTSTTDSAASP